MIKIDANAPLTIDQPAVKPGERNERMLEQAKAFESVFVSQMLKHAGFEKALASKSGFGGQSFASLLLEQYATKIVENGGLGLTEKIYQQLVDREKAS